jgi:mono/diheme cytochrome c family protein
LCSAIAPAATLRPGGKPFAGGAALETPFGKLLGPNITPDVATGIGGWSESDLWRAMHEGIGRDGIRLYPAMPYPAYTKVTREDVLAIWAYLRTLEPVRNEVQPNQLRYAPDLTADSRVGISHWSTEDIVRYLKTGANAFDIASGPMAEAVENSTSHMTDADLLAIATYLKDRAPRSANTAAALEHDNTRIVAGKAIYENRCAACHMSSGAGVPTLFPRLAQAPLVQSTDPTSLIRVVLIGSRAVATSAAPTAPAMPSFGWTLSDTEIADVLTYVRNTWGNAASAVQSTDVGTLRGRVSR